MNLILVKNRSMKMDTLINQIKKQQIDLKSQIHPDTKRQATKQLGMGFFAQKDIKSGVIVAEKKGFVLKENQLLRLIGEKRLIPDPYSQGSYSQIEQDTYLCGVDEESVLHSMIGINHSCNPNVGKIGNTQLITMRNIRKGEQLTTDYGFQLNNDWFKMNCKCGAENCRGTITGKDWKLILHKKKWFSKHIKNVLVK